MSKKSIFLLFNIVIFGLLIKGMTFASLYSWVGDPKTGKWTVYNFDEQIKNKLIYDDIDNDGIAYYYYVDGDGYVLIDTICPDYHIVDASGRRLDKYGEPETKEITMKDLNNDGSTSTDGIIPELYEQYLQDMDSNQTVNNGAVSVGALRQMEDVSGFGPNLFLGETVSSDKVQSIIGKGVVFKEKEKPAYDVTIDPEMKNYIKSGNAYSKSVNGTTFSKSKWKAVMALKGSGAYIDFENPKNNFNKITGRVATHYFTYSDRETRCTLHVYDESNEEIYSTTDFNYNSGKKFSFAFPKKCKVVRFELTVDGQYSTRVVYLRDMKYGFDREAWEEEKEQDIEDAIIESMIAEAANEQYYDEEEEAKREALIDAETDIDEDGYTKQERAMLASMSNADNDKDDTEEDDTEVDEVDEVDDSDVDPENLKAREEDQKAGPSFDEELQEAAKRKANYGPGFAGIVIE
ncbi:MAG: hypothetical protein MJ151_01530 [Lachnospiraceae bacterium]|nr:hypothetical protein [Lachnospiraceae bacterium]